MTPIQSTILHHMNDGNIGAFYFDLDQRWVWRCDVRDDAALAERISTFMPWITK